MFVFPKFFEFFKFFKYLKSKYTISNIRKCDHDIFVFEFFEKYEKLDQIKIVYKLDVYVPNESDIRFNQLLNSVLKNVNDDSHCIDSIILIGSCGSTKKEDIYGNFIIDRAYKCDRGLLDINNKFFIDKVSKILNEVYQVKEEYKVMFLNKSISSINFLNESSIDIVDKDNNNFFFLKNNISLYETYDFYNTCSQNEKIKKYFSIRFVTDLIYDGNKLDEEEINEHKENYFSNILNKEGKKKSIIGEIMEKKKKSFKWFYKIEKIL